MKQDIEIPFGAKDSELVEATYNIPEGMEAIIEGDKVVIRKRQEETMDYEKLYKEALSRAKRLHGIPTGCTERIVCEQIFPILMESEDERTRKWIIEELKDTLHSEDIETNMPEYVAQIKKAIAWLEKQGEKSDEWKEGDVVRHGGILALVIKGRRAMKSNGEIVNVTPYPTWYKENGQGPDRREWNEEELEIISTSTKKYVDIEKACEYWVQRANESETGIIMYFILSCIADFKKTMEE